MLGALARIDADLDDTSRLVEIYTLEGLLQVWWFGLPGATDIGIMGGGTMGGFTGPGRAGRCTPPWASDWGPTAGPQ